MNIPELTGSVDYPFSLYLNLKNLIDKKIIKKHAIFLDLGSGSGKQVVTASRLSLNAYGIELNKASYEISIKNIKESSTPAKISLGSYYPKDYIESRNKNKSLLKDYEKGIFIDTKNTDNKRNFSQNEINSCFFPVSTDKDTYKELGIQLNDIDVLFSYTWGPEFASQLELFSRYCKKTTIFLHDSYTHHEKINELLQKLKLKCSMIDISGRNSLMMIRKI